MKTCTAPGHSSCSITCPNGCIALYVEPNGPCETRCSGGFVLDIDTSKRFSVQISDMPAAELGRIIGPSLDASVKSSLSSSNRLVSISLQNIKLNELVEAINNGLLS